MNRLIENTVFSEFVTAWRLATWPTQPLPLLVEGHHGWRQPVASDW